MVGFSEDGPGSYAGLMNSGQRFFSVRQGASVSAGRPETSERNVERALWPTIARTVSTARPSILYLLQVFLLACAVAYVVWQNTFLSEDWWYLPLRDIDDMAMNSATEDMRQAFSEAAWGRVASFFAYAYGAGFYLLMALLTFPAHLLDSPQLQILIGRNASLVAVFLTSLVVALIGRRVFPEHRRLWLVAVGFGFITPIALIDSTKMHVNGWSTLFGTLAIYLLVHEPRLSRTFLYLASLSMGAAIGFKLTALTVLPVFGAIVLTRLTKNRVPNLFGSLAGVGFSAVLVGAPILLAYPIHPQGASQIIDPFLRFAGMGSGGGGNGFTRLWDGLGFYGHPLALVGLVGLTLLLAARAKRPPPDSLRAVLPVTVAGTAIVAWALLALLVDKSAVYLATYALNISVFLPVGVFALGRFRVRPISQLGLGWTLVLLNLFLSPQFDGTVTKSQNYAAKASSSDIQRKLVAATDISLILGDVQPGTRVLMDASSVLPVSDIRSGIPISMSYGNLAAKLPTTESRGDFAYIVFDTSSYIGTPNPLEEETRRSLREKGRFGEASYELVYSDNGTELYALVTGQR